jgi:hypothetical protein
MRDESLQRQPPRVADNVHTRGIRAPSSRCRPFRREFVSGKIFIEPPRPQLPETLWSAGF